MSDPIIRTESSHWYWPDGRCCFTVPRADGKGDRRTTLADARKLGLLPSVTTILKCWPKDALQGWILGQHILAGATTPRVKGETDDQFVARCQEAAESTSRAAADVGSRRHAIVERYHREQFIDATSPDFRFVEPYFQWLRDNVATFVDGEFVVINSDFGYAGTTDLACILKDGRPAIVDTKNRKGLKTYETDAMQLAAYGHCDRWRVCPALFSIVLGTEEPAIHVKEWVDTETPWQDFQLTHKVFCRSKNYDYREHLKAA